jgi:hypothetical protein
MLIIVLFLFPLHFFLFIYQRISTSKNTSRTLFFAISDDEDWLESNLEPRPNLVIMKISTPELAFALLTRADVSVITDGSFGLWGGIMAGGKILRLLPGFPPDEKDKFQGIEEDLPFVKGRTYT